MIARDGYCTSLWQDQPLYKPVNRVPGNTVYDVIIAGGGITGISTALLLQEAGKKCLLIEAANLCFGTTGGTTAHLNTLLDTSYADISKNFGKENAALVAKAAAEAIALIRSNISKYHISCGFEEAEACLFAQDDDQRSALEKIFEASAEAGLDVRYENRSGVPVPFKKAMWVTGQAKFNPVQYVHGLAAAYENAGGVILEQSRVTGADEHDPLTIHTANGSYQANALIYATHIPIGVNLLHLRCVPYRSYAMALTLQTEHYPESLFYDMYDPYHYYRSQVVNGKTYLIAGGNDHKTGHHDHTEKCFLDLEAYLRKYFNIKTIDYRWSSQYFEPADGLPYIGHLPAHGQNVFVATGYGGNGMVYSSVAASLLCKLVLQQESEYTSLFKPGRIKPIAGFSSFISHNADAARQLLSKLIPPHALDQLAEMAAGEAMVTRYNNEKIALYKDEQGGVHAVDPNCTHLGCEIKWNEAERSWDCPCHGARYSVDGEVLTGPTHLKLEQLRLEQTVR